MSASSFLSSSFSLNASSTKVIVCALDVDFKEIKPCVYLCKNDAKGVEKIKLNADEWKMILEREEIISRYFYPGGDDMQGSSFVINANLRIRFENMYDTKMIVVERTGSTYAVNAVQKNIKITIWFADKTWFNFVRLLPTISYVTHKQGEWIPEIREMLIKIASHVKSLHPDQATTVQSYRSYKKTLDGCDALSFMFDSPCGLDVKRCVLETFASLNDVIIQIICKSEEI